jgi:hypothetical protein
MVLIHKEGKSGQYNEFNESEEECQEKTRKKTYKQYANRYFIKIQPELFRCYLKIYR